MKIDFVNIVTRLTRTEMKLELFEIEIANLRGENAELKKTLDELKTAPKSELNGKKEKTARDILHEWQTGEEVE